MSYLSCADTAKLVRQALKEAFPGVTFVVRSKTYSMGASIRVSWIDGPTLDQVESLTRTFRESHFDGQTGCKTPVHHVIDGQQVHFGADFIHCDREYSDRMIQHAIAAVQARYTVPVVPTVEGFRNGIYWRDQLPTGDLQNEIRRNLSRRSDRAAPNHSALVDSIAPRQRDAAA